MKIYALILFLINIPSSVFACMYHQEIEKSDLNKIPLIAYINEEKDSINFYLYLKDDGNLSGLDSFYIDIEPIIEESISSGYLDLKHQEEPSLFTIGFSIQRVNIPHVKIGICAVEVDMPPEIGEDYETSGHSIHYVYIINLKDIFETYSEDGTSWDMLSNPNKYKDEKLEKFLKTKFEKNRNRGEDL